MRIDAFPADFGWCLAIQGAVNTMLVIISTILRQLFLQVDGVPEEYVVEGASCKTPKSSEFLGNSRPNFEGVPGSFLVK